MTDWSAVLALAFERVGQGRGDSGDSGDNPTKVLRIIANQPSARVTTADRPVVTVVTQSAAVTTVTTPLVAGGDTGRNVFGTKVQALQPTVTTVTTVNTNNEPFGERALDRLRLMTPLESFGAEVWRHLLLDAETFFQRWSAQAQLLGWSDVELLGVHPCAPAARYDAMGLVLLIKRGEVIELQGQCATIRSQGGSLLAYRKHRYEGAALPWQIINRRPS